MHGDDTVCVDLSNCTRLHARKSHVEAARALRADPCENDCKAAADELARQTQDMNRCRDLKDLIQPEDPFEGEQGNCLHGMGPEAMPAFKPGDRVRGKYTGREMEVIGPASGYRVRYLDNDRETTATADLLEPIPADPRVDVVRNVLLPMIADAELRAAIACDVVAALDAWGEKTVTFPKWEGE